jgi:hypothetical protein
LFEPINRFAGRAADTWAGYDLAPVGEIGAKLRAVYDAIQPRDSDPMLDFDERDLLRLVEEVGFFPIGLRLDVAIEPKPPRPWDAFLNSAGNPTIPTVAEWQATHLITSAAKNNDPFTAPTCSRGRRER